MINVTIVFTTLGKTFQVYHLPPPFFFFFLLAWTGFCCLGPWEVGAVGDVGCPWGRGELASLPDPPEANLLLSLKAM